MGVIPFALFLYDRLEDEFPGGPPSPPSFGPLIWSGDLGPQRRFTFAELMAICAKGNLAALSASHFHLLPHHPAHLLVQRLEEALCALSTRMNATLREHPAIRVRWAPTEVVDLDPPDSSTVEGSCSGPASSSALIPSSSGGMIPPLSVVPRPPPSKRPRLPTLMASSQVHLATGVGQRTRLRRSSLTPATTQVSPTLEVPNKRQRQTSLTHYWRRQAPNEVDIPLMILHSPSDDDNRASSPPPKRGRVELDGVAREGIG